MHLISNYYICNRDGNTYLLTAEPGLARIDAGAPSLACITLDAVMGRSLSTASLPEPDTACCFMADFSRVRACCIG